MIRLISEWARSNASRRVSSDTSRAPASTIVIASRVPATTRSRSVSFSSSHTSGGFTTRRPSRNPMRTAPTGPPKGIEEIDSAADAPMTASTSGALSWSALSTVAITWTSLRNPLGNSGRSGRSMRRALSVARSPGRPSRLKKPPGIFPAANIFSSKSQVSGKKSMPSRGDVDIVAVTSTTVSPYRTTTAPFA